MAYVDEAITDNPRFYWRMAGSASPVADSGSAGVGLTVTGGTFGVTGPMDGSTAVSFNGSSDSATAALVLGDTAILTLAGFVKWDAYADDDALLCEFNGPWFDNTGSFIINPNDAGGTWFIGMNGNGALSGWTFPRSAFSAAEWHHLVIVLDRPNDTAKVYVDGAEVTVTQTASAADPSATFANDVLYLMSRDGTSLFGAGSLSETELVKAELTAERVGVLASFFVPSVFLGARHSGGTGNTTGSASLGGAVGGTLTESPGALFGTPTNAERVAGLTDYRCVYIRNAGNLLAEDVRAWIASASGNPAADEAIGEDTGNPAQTIANATTAPTGVSFSAPSDYSGGLTLGDLDEGEAIPVWIRRDVDAGADSGARSFTLAVSWDGAAAPVEIAVSYSIVVPATIYVAADNPAASDSYTRAQATNPDTPYFSAQAAAKVAQPGDTIQIEPATIANAIDVDPSVYAFIHHNAIDSSSSDTLAFGDNTGNEPILVKGTGTIGVDAPKMHQPAGRGFKNWTFEDIQMGYDRGSGLDKDTSGTLQNTGEGMTFRHCRFTGGAYYIVSFTHDVLFEDCQIYSPRADTGGFMNGAGVHVIAADTSEVSTFRTGTITFRGSRFEDITGEDCIQASLGPIDVGSKMIVENCSFHGIAQSVDPGAPHTDCIQSLGGAEYIITGNWFHNCATPFIASDDQNGRIVIARNIMEGGFGIGIQGQGTHEYIIVHNTIQMSQGSGLSVALGGRTAGVVQNVYMVNNILQGWAPVDAIVDDASVIADNVMTNMPGLVTEWGTQLPGLPEFGPSTRLTTAGITAALELANSPTTSVGIGAGRVLTDAAAEFAAEDFFGRAYASPPDVGALQSDATTITPAPRAPYVVDAAPVGNGAPRDSDITVRFLPKPGETIDAATVTTSSFYVTDSGNQTIPALVTLTDPDDDGYQQVTLDLKYTASPAREGRLDYLVLYTAHLTSAIEDTEGSPIPATSWEFRAQGRTDTHGDPAPAISRLDTGTVGLLSTRTASFLIAGPSTAGFEQPTTSASFEQAEAVVVR